MNHRNACVYDDEVGVGGTSKWKITGIDPNTTLAVYFEIVNQHNTPLPDNSRPSVQFITDYTHADGSRRKRVTTIQRQWADTKTGTSHIAASFDQNASAVLMARLAIIKSMQRDGPDVLRWLDRLLIGLCQKFGDYQNDAHQSFQFPANFSLYPQVRFSNLVHTNGLLSFLTRVHF